MESIQSHQIVGQVTLRNTDDFGLLALESPPYSYKHILKEPLVLGPGFYAIWKDQLGVYTSRGELVRVETLQFEEEESCLDDRGRKAAS